MVRVDPITGSIKFVPEKQVNIYEAKTHLSRLIDEVEAGAEIVIARNGRPVARLVPLERRGVERRPGSLRGQIWISPDFDAADEEIIAMFEDGALFPPAPAPAVGERRDDAADRPRVDGAA